MNLIKRTSRCSGVLTLSFIIKLVIFHSAINLVDSKAVLTTTPSSSITGSESSPKTIVEVSSMKSESPSMEDANNNATTTTIAPNNNNVDKKSVIQVEGNSTHSNSTSSNYIAAEYKPLVFESPEDTKIQQEWGGNCTVEHWNQCKALASWFGNYEDPKDGEIKEYTIDCRTEPVVCLTNSWTVTRCNILCMGRCNRELLFKYDKYVSHNGECQAHAHG